MRKEKAIEQRCKTSRHPSAGCFPNEGWMQFSLMGMQFSNITFDFLLKNTTNELQPLD
jgi:hypothetical protein